MDVGIWQIESAEMKPVHVLLRETGWRDTDVLNLRYDNCLQYIWNAKENQYDHASKSKGVLIEAKDKRIARPEEENHRL